MESIAFKMKLRATFHRLERRLINQCSQVGQYPLTITTN
jgi:hypothetical protein